MVLSFFFVTPLTPPRSLAVLYLLPSARRISSPTNPMIPLIIKMPFLSLNPKKLLSWAQMGAGRRHYQLDSCQIKLRLEGPEEDKEPPSCPDAIARRRPETPRMEEPNGELRNWQTWPEDTWAAGNPRNCWTGGTVVQRKTKNKNKKKRRLKRNRQTHTAQQHTDL